MQEITQTAIKTTASQAADRRAKIGKITYELSLHFSRTNKNIQRENKRWKFRFLPIRGGKM